MATQRSPIEFRSVTGYAPFGTVADFGTGSATAYKHGILQVNRNLIYRKMYFGFVPHWAGIVRFVGQLQFRVLNEVTLAIPFDYSEPYPGNGIQNKTAGIIPPFQTVRGTIGNEVLPNTLVEDSLTYLSVRPGSNLPPQNSSFATLIMVPMKFCTDIDSVNLEISLLTSTDYSTTRVQKANDSDTYGVDWFLGMTSQLNPF